MQLVRNRIYMQLICCFFVTLVLTGCSIDKETKDDSSHVPESSCSELNGIIYDASNATLAVIDENGNVYHFKKNDDTNIKAENGIIIGNRVTILYIGELEKTEAVQKVEIVSITVLADKNDNVQPPSNPEPSAPEMPYSESNLQNIIKDMSIEEKVGQLFIVRCPVEDQVDSINDYHLGGYILFSRDFKGKTKQKLIEEIQSYQASSEIKMLIAVDEEGGEVNRLSLYKSFRAVPFWSAQDLYRKGGWELITNDTVDKAKLLKSLGINVNMAPVCDVSENPNDYIYKRTFGKNAEETSRYVETVVKAMSDEKLGSVLKHFPGYGNNEDTHTGIAYDKRSYETFVNNDFKPFEAGIKAGADSILVSHNIVEAIDDQYPASLSPKVHSLLRNELNYDGVIMTDDLVMDAIKDYVGVNEAAVVAVLAGNDLLCCTDFQVQIPEVVKAVKNGIISEEQINASVLRILKWKSAIGILHQLPD